MEFSKGHILVAIIMMALILFNVLFTRDTLNWVPSIKKRFLLVFAIWFMPILGMYIANKYGSLGWFAGTKKDRGPSAISQGFMEADAAFNPGMRNRVEIVEQQKSEIVQENAHANGPVGSKSEK